MRIFNNVVGFEWDDGNKDKNLIKHGVSNEECEEVFLTHNKVILKDVLHSQNEERYILLGEISSGVKLYVVFTIRADKIRVISARRMNKKEYKLLNKKNYE